MIQSRFVPRVENVRCPCGGRFSVGVTHALGVPPEAGPTVVHSWPMCTKFAELDCNDFLQYVRLAQ